MTIYYTTFIINYFFLNFFISPPKTAPSLTPLYNPFFTTAPFPGFARLSPEGGKQISLRDSSADPTSPLLVLPTLSQPCRRGTVTPLGCAVSPLRGGMSEGQGGYPFPRMSRSDRKGAFVSRGFVKSRGFV